MDSDMTNYIDMDPDELRDLPRRLSESAESGKDRSPPAKPLREKPHSGVEQSVNEEKPRAGKKGIFD
ncbi:unnamed protein product, partial [Mesorhabditis belari]|uniref:Uncharacterized protein n=1 Tax=Mesorhabditis belari TaxID=2138241 RepID=A0AAF3EL84_9BILA